MEAKEKTVRLCMSRFTQTFKRTTFMEVWTNAICLKVMVKCFIKGMVLQNDIQMHISVKRKRRVAAPGWPSLATKCAIFPDPIVSNPTSKHKHA